MLLHKWRMRIFVLDPPDGGWHFFMKLDRLTKTEGGPVVIWQKWPYCFHPTVSLWMHGLLTSFSGRVSRNWYTWAGYEINKLSVWLSYAPVWKPSCHSSQLPTIDCIETFHRLPDTAIIHPRPPYNMWEFGFDIVLAWMSANHIHRLLALRILQRS